MLETVTRLFHQQGYNATGVNQIVAESGVVKSSVYQNFGSKEGIAIAYLNERHRYWFESLYDHIAVKRTGRETVLAAFDFICLMNAKEDFQGCAFLNLSSEISKENITIREVITNHKNDVRIFFQEQLKYSEVNADAVYLLFEGALTESKLFRADWPVEAAKSIIQTIYI